MAMEKEEKIMAPIYLSVCIPTWNRVVFLQENIEQLLREIEKFPQLSIEIVISDNASTDGTQAYCESLTQQYDYVKYHRNAENEGPNANFKNVIEIANGTYVWLLGDDDKIVEDCFEKIITDAKYFKEPDILIGGSINDVTQRRIYPPFVKKPLLTDKSILKNYDGIRLAGKISVLIFKRAPLLPILKKLQTPIRSLKTPWPHVMWVIALLNQDRKILFLHYGTNYFMEKNRCNILFDGISNINILVLEYAALIYRLNDLHLLDSNFYKLLVRSITHKRQTELLKAVGYSTYLNNYSSALSNSFSNFRHLHDAYNRINFFFFYIAPLTLPIFIRKLLLNAVAFIFSKKIELKRYVSHLQSAKKLFTEENKRNIFVKADL